MKGICGFLMLLGRWCLSIAFLWAGFYKIFWFHSSIESYQELTSYSKDATTWVVIVTLIVEIIFGFLLAIGWLARFAALVLAVYVACMILIFMPFWNMEGIDKLAVLTEFLKGVGIIGGLFYVMGCGAGLLSCDAIGRCKKNNNQ